jgi:hypothetical protein
MLEPCDAKVSSTVLRGPGDRKVAWLLGRNAKQITCRTRFGVRVLFAFFGMNNADSALYAALKSLGPRDGALITAFHVYWVVQKVPRIAFYFTQSATTGFIASVFPSRSRVSFKEAFAGPELCDWKLSCTVLRGLDSSNGVRLLGKLARTVLRGPGPSNGVWLLGFSRMQLSRRHVT